VSVISIFVVLSETGSNEDIASSLHNDGGKLLPASGMASVMAKILCKSVNSSKPVILSKCKTDRELSTRKRTEKHSDSIENEPVNQLQTAKVQRDLIIKVGVDSLLVLHVCIVVDACIYCTLYIVHIYCIWCNDDH